MSHISITGLTKHFDGKPPTKAVDDLHLEIEDGEFLVLLGPSGCGKTTTLRCLAGLETPSAGRIDFGTKSVFDVSKRLNLSPDKRSIGMVFQSYSLWPHMTVRQNIAYPLKARKLKDGLKGGWVEQTAGLVDCSTLLDRYPSQLSGGQQQRVALARGLVARPELVLFDEPLSNLDARLRDLVRGEIHELHVRTGFTAVFVTHDQSEALALGDRIAIMKGGRIEQYGTPEDVFERPKSEYVAAFIGMPNTLNLTYDEGGWRSDGVPLGGARLGVPDGGTLSARLRADDLSLFPVGAEVPSDLVTLQGQIVDWEYGGRIIDVVVATGGTRVFARIPAGESDSFARRLTRDQPVTVGFRSVAVRLFDAEGLAVQPLGGPAGSAGAVKVAAQFASAGQS